jgi:hypothetical protein
MGREPRYGRYFEGAESIVLRGFGVGVTSSSTSSPALAKTTAPPRGINDLFIALLTTAGFRFDDWRTGDDPRRG